MNAATTQDMYPLSRIDNALDALADTKFFTTLDAWTRYWQVPIDPADRAKTVFTTQGRYNEFNVISFRLVNAPSTFQ